MAADDERGALTPRRADSPCRRQCTLDPHDVCLGCGRTLAEICGWSGYGEAERQRVLEECARRLAERRVQWSSRP